MTSSNDRPSAIAIFLFISSLCCLGYVAPSAAYAETSKAIEMPAATAPADIPPSIRLIDDDEPGFAPVLVTPVPPSPTADSAVASPQLLTTAAPQGGPAQPLPPASNPAQPAASPVRTATPKPKSLDPFALQIEFAESALTITPTLASRGRVISIYERALAAACPGKKARCDEIIDRLLQLDTGNVPAICQRFGIVSPECKEVIAAQEIGWYDVTVARWRSLSALDGGPLEAEDLTNAITLKQQKPLIDKLTSEREALIKIPRRETAQELALDKVLADGIAATCTGPKIVFLARGPEIPEILGPAPEVVANRKAPIVAGQLTGSLRVKDEIHTPPASLDPLGLGASGAAQPLTVPPMRTMTSTSPLDSVISGLNALPTPTSPPKPTAKPASRISAPIDERLRRMRLLSRECYDFVRVARSLRPEMRAAYCAYDGWYAPTCRGAPVGVGVPQSSSDGIDSF